MEKRKNAIISVVLISLLASCGEKRSSSPLNLESGYGLTADAPNVESDNLDQYNSITITKEASKVSLNHKVHDGTANNILITGTEVVLDATQDPFGANGLMQLNSVYSLTVDAQRIIIRNKIKLPQANIILNAEQIIFEDAGIIDITPNGFESASYPQLTQGQNGRDGLPGSQIKLLANEVVIRGDQAKARLVAVGGAGQVAGPGRNGSDGVSLPAFTTEPSDGRAHGVVYMEQLHEKETCSNPRYNRERDDSAIFMRQCFGGNLIPERGSKQWPTDGGDAVPAGAPGAGGAGGTVIVQTNTINGTGADKTKVAMISNISRGVPGTPGSKYSKGKAGQPQFAAWKMVRNNHTGMPQYFLVTKTTVDGKDADSPQTPVKLNPDGQVGIEGFSRLSHSESYYKGRLRLIRDKYIAKKFPLVKKMLEDDLTEMTSGKSYLETQARYSLLLNRINLQQDYFGHSIDEAPLYTLDFRLNQFDAEIEMALTSYYLTEKVLKALDNKNLKKEQLTTLIAQHQKVISAESEKQNIRGSKVVALEGMLQGLRQNEDAYDQLLLDLNRQVEEQSARNVAKKHQWNALKQNIKVLASLSKVIPAGQPTLAAAGTVLDYLSDIPSSGSVTDYISYVSKAKKDWEKAFSQENLTKSRASFDTLFDKLRVSNLDNKSSLEKIQYIEQLQKELAPIHDQITEISQGFSGAIVPADELQAEIEKIKLADPFFQTAAQNLETIVKQRAEAYKTMQETVQELMASAVVIEQAIVLSLASQDQYLHLASFGDSTLRDLIKSIHDMSKDRLLLIYNEVIKAYEYTTLESLPDSAQFALLKEKAVELAETEGSSEDSIKILKSFYMSFIYKVVVSLDNKFNSSSPLMLVRNDSVYLDLSEEQLKELNAMGATRMLLNKEVFGSHQKNIRIADIEIEKTQFSNDPQALEGTQKTYIEVSHGGQGVIEGERGVSRNFTYAASNKLHIWGSSFQFLGTEVIESRMKRDESVKGILGLLLRDKTNALLYSPIFAQPAALTTLNVIKRDHGGKRTMTGMRIKVNYTFY